MSEKYDGVRAFWNGERLISNYGNQLASPAWFTRGLPRMPIDGELWMGRDSLEQLMSAIKSKTDSWRLVKYMVFDLPKLHQPIEVRMQHLAKMELPSHVQAVVREQCLGRDHLISTMNKIIEEGGEGLMVNKPGSMYVQERTQDLLKVKVGRYLVLIFRQKQSDTEVMLLEVLPTGFYCLQ